MPTQPNRHPTATGHQAESLACSYLEGLGHHIVARNWRTRYCELDIVTRRQNVIHIVEVKYRASKQWGSATEYILSAKADRLARAANAWCQAHQYTGAWQIDIVAIDGPLDGPEITYIANALFS